MRKVTLAFALCAALAAGCTVKETEDEDGEGTDLEVQPANVEIGTDTATVKVPDVDITPADSPVTTQH